MLLKDIEKSFPFISVVQYGGNEYVGIIINQDQFVTSMYVYTNIRSVEEKQQFLELGEAWWWESNRLIPISIFMRDEVSPFKYCIMTMNSKDVKVTIGPTVNLNNMAIKRIKRKSVQLVKKPKG
mgnify:CR=1 FL=1|jgi:hypothetical protein|tara:strand:- start:1175 stop:1546 length:372 start_codon:yes stop_codon:yes gene_type:complete